MICRQYKNLKGLFWKKTEFHSHTWHPDTCRFLQCRQFIAISRFRIDTIRTDKQDTNASCPLSSVHCQNESNLMYFRTVNPKIHSSATSAHLSPCCLTRPIYRHIRGIAWLWKHGMVSKREMLAELFEYRTTCSKILAFWQNFFSLSEKLFQPRSGICNFSNLFSRWWIIPVLRRKLASRTAGKPPLPNRMSNSKSQKQTPKQGNTLFSYFSKTPKKDSTPQKGKKVLSPRRSPNKPETSPKSGKTGSPVTPNGCGGFVLPVWFISYYY